MRHQINHKCGIINIAKNIEQYHNDKIMMKTKEQDENENFDNNDDIPFDLCEFDQNENGRKKEVNEEEEDEDSSSVLSDFSSDVPPDGNNGKKELNNDNDNNTRSLHSSQSINSMSTFLSSLLSECGRGSGISGDGGGGGRSVRQDLNGFHIEIVPDNANFEFNRKKHAPPKLVKLERSASRHKIYRWGDESHIRRFQSDPCLFGTASTIAAPIASSSAVMIKPTRRGSLIEGCSTAFAPPATTTAVLASSCFASSMSPRGDRINNGSRSINSFKYEYAEYDIPLLSPTATTKTTTTGRTITRNSPIAAPAMQKTVKSDSDLLRMPVRLSSPTTTTNSIKKAKKITKHHHHNRPHQRDVSILTDNKSCTSGGGSKNATWNNADLETALLKKMNSNEGLFKILLVAPRNNKSKSSGKPSSSSSVVSSVTGSTTSGSKKSTKSNRELHGDASCCDASGTGIRELSKKSESSSGKVVLLVPPKKPSSGKNFTSNVPSSGVVFKKSNEKGDLHAPTSDVAPAVKNDDSSGGIFKKSSSSGSMELLRAKKAKEKKPSSSAKAIIKNMNNNVFVPLSSSGGPHPTTTNNDTVGDSPVSGLEKMSTSSGSMELLGVKARKKKSPLSEKVPSLASSGVSKSSINDFFVPLAGETNVASRSSTSTSPGPRLSKKSASSGSMELLHAKAKKKQSSSNEKNCVSEVSKNTHNDSFVPMVAGEPRTPIRTSGTSSSVASSPRSGLCKKYALFDCLEGLVRFKPNPSSNKNAVGEGVGRKSSPSSDGQLTSSKLSSRGGNSYVKSADGTKTRKDQLRISLARIDANNIADVEGGGLSKKFASSGSMEQLLLASSKRKKTPSNGKDSSSVASPLAGYLEASVISATGGGLSKESASSCSMELLASSKKKKSSGEKTSSSVVSSRDKKMTREECRSFLASPLDSNTGSLSGGHGLTSKSSTSSSPELFVSPKKKSSSRKSSTDVAPSGTSTKKRSEQELRALLTGLDVGSSIASRSSRGGQANNSASSDAIRGRAGSHPSISTIASGSKRNKDSSPLSELNSTGRLDAKSTNIRSSKTGGTHKFAVDIGSSSGTKAAARFPRVSMPRKNPFESPQLPERMTSPETSNKIHSLLLQKEIQNSYTSGGGRGGGIGGVRMANLPSSNSTSVAYQLPGKYFAGIPSSNGRTSGAACVPKNDVVRGGLAPPASSLMAKGFVLKQPNRQYARTSKTC